jgi:hypothetical protein
VSGFGSKSSDIDVSINTNCYVDERKFLRLIFEMLKFYINRNNKTNEFKLEIILNAKVPVVKY